jgi:hypothetical protein
VSESTEALIERLAARAEPVRRLRPPVVRALAWLALTTVVSAVAVAWLADMETFFGRARELRQLIELGATLATGLLAIVAAFHLSVPDRSPRWALLPLPTLAVWLAVAGAGCVASWVNGTASDLGESSECFAIIVAVSIPLGITVLWALARAKPLVPSRVAAVGGLGVAALAAFLLQFFHPFDVTVLDLALHAVAVALVVGAASWSPRLVPSLYES